MGSIPGWEDPLEKGMATHSRILDWRIPWTEEPGRLQSMSYKGSDATERLTHSATKAAGKTCQEVAPAWADSKQEAEVLSCV